LNSSDPWFGRVLLEHRAGNLTPGQKDCLHFLRTFRGRGGRIYPSHETLADRAGHSVSTVQRALQAARALGLVRWAERRVRKGWRWVRTSNAYELIVPGNAENPATPTTGQTDRVTLRVSTSLLPSVVRAVAPGAKAARERHAAELAATLEAAKRLPDLVARRLAQWEAGQVRLAK
jgi:DNA-binding transcriptional MocR family regulator